MMWMWIIFAALGGLIVGWLFFPRLDDEAKAIVKRQKKLNEQFGNPALKKEAAEARKKFAEEEAAVKKAAEAKK